jgi:intracellular multiplication protein IcmL
MADDLSEIEKIQLELSRFSGNYYRNNFRRAVAFLLVMISLNVVLVGVLGYLYATTPHDPAKFYASNTHSGEVTQLYPLSAPMLKPAKLLDWTSKTVTAAYTFNFANYRKVFESLRKFFTDSGWKDFNNMLKNSRILDEVINKELFITTEVIGTPSILDDGIIDGHYAWRVRIPVSTTYKFADKDTGEETKQSFIINVIVIRVPDLDNPEQVAIINLSVS